MPPQPSAQLLIKPNPGTTHQLTMPPPAARMPAIGGELQPLPQAGRPAVVP